MAIIQSKASHLIGQHPGSFGAVDHLIHLIESSTEANPLVSNISKLVLPIFGNALTNAVRVRYFVIPMPTSHPAPTPPITIPQSEHFDRHPLQWILFRKEGAHGH